MDVTLGQKVKCTVTGFTGIATSRVEYMNGCVQYGITAKVGKDNKIEVVYIDAGQIEIMAKGVSIKKKNTGGYRVDQPKY